MRGRVCRLQLLLALASLVILGSKSLRTRDHILLSQIRDFISSPPTTRRVTVAVFEPASTWDLIQPALDSSYIASGRIQQKTSFCNNFSIVIEVCLLHCYIETAVLLLREFSFPKEPVYRVVA
jgi:hypothetical protein